MLIPITGEPAELLGRRIRTIEMPRDYVPYDSNLKRARTEAAQIVSQFADELPKLRAVRSDIFGALRAAADFTQDRQTMVICLSDLVEDDATLQFRTAPELGNATAAEHLAARRATPGMLRRTTVSLGLLRSAEIERMSPERRTAVRAFWEKYLMASGAGRVEITVDLDALRAADDRQKTPQARN